LEPPVLIFDLDGTLTDPRPGIVRCMKYALDKLGAPCPADDVLAPFIGPPLRGTFATLLETADRPDRASADALPRRVRWHRAIREPGLRRRHPMLDHARLVASAAFVATLKPKVYADRIVRRLGLEPYFAGVYGPELEEGRFDDKAELLGQLLATEEVSPERAIMIGDRAGDIVGARANRVRSIGVLWGYGSESELGDAGADGLCATPDDLAACLGRLAL